MLGFAISKYPFLAELGIKAQNLGALYNGEWQVNNSTTTLTSYNPTTEQPIAACKGASLQDYENALSAMQVANKEWRSVPMPVRGEIVRQIGVEMRAKKEPLGRLLSLEMGKIYS